jgi:hypothetical protein
MSAEEGQEGSQGFDDNSSQFGGPGAPTPLAQLEAWLFNFVSWKPNVNGS